MHCVNLGNYKSFGEDVKSAADKKSKVYLGCLQVLAVEIFRQMDGSGKNYPE